MYDVVICGAGPAGACAGYEAAAAGLKALILEKRVLPRYKTCGGGLPLSVGSELPHLVPEAFVEATVTHLRHTWNFGDAYLAPLNPDPGDKPMSLWMVQRSVFDNALTERAAQAGCEVRDGVSVKSIEPEGETLVRVTTADGEEYFASHVVGADGANGVVARMAELRKKRMLAIALEAEIPHEWGQGHETLTPEVGHLEYAVKQGYAWVFPKAGHLSVGAGMFGRRSAEGRGEASKAELSRWVVGYLAALGVPADPKTIEFTAILCRSGAAPSRCPPGTGGCCWRATPPGWSTRCSGTAFPTPAGRALWQAKRLPLDSPPAGPQL